MPNSERICKLTIYLWGGEEICQKKVCRQIYTLSEDELVVIRAVILLSAICIRRVQKKNKNQSP